MGYTRGNEGLNHRFPHYPHYKLFVNWLIHYREITSQSCRNISLTKQGHHPRGDQVTRPPLILCSICVPSFESSATTIIAVHCTNSQPAVLRSNGPYYMHLRLTSFDNDNGMLLKLSYKINKATPTNCNDAVDWVNSDIATLSISRSSKQLHTLCSIGVSSLVPRHHESVNVEKIWTLKLLTSKYNEQVSLLNEIEPEWWTPVHRCVSLAERSRLRWLGVSY